MMRALIVDDEMHAREELGSLLRQTGAFEVVGSCADAVSALQALRAERPDVLFLDIQMPAISGFELLSMIDDDRMPRVVFVTAHDEHALRAFEENAVDYLLKPVALARLERTVERLRLEPADPGVVAQLRSAIPRIPCQAGRAIKLVDASEIEFARSSEAGVYVVWPQGGVLHGADAPGARGAGRPGAVPQAVPGAARPDRGGPPGRGHGDAPYPFG